jgi:hypothetical protein
MSKRFVIQGLLLAGLACSTTHPAARTTVAPAPQHDSVTASRTSGWTPRVSPGKWQYLIRDSSTISMTNDTTGHVEPIESRTTYTLSIADSDSVLILSGRIDSLFVNSRLSRKQSFDAGEQLELHGVLSTQGHFSETGTAASATCTGTTVSPASRLSELVLIFPTEAIKVGDKWSDTTVTTVCHGKIPLTQVMVRNYQLMDPSGCQQRAARVQRTISDSLSGASPEDNNHLSASGSGTGSSILCLDRDTGVLLESNGQSHLELTITTSRGKFPFTQNTSTHIQLH